MKNSSLQINVDMETGKLQRKLKAIAKHAEALAQELDAIDNEWTCPACGSDEYETVEIPTASESKLEKLYTCSNCTHEHHETKIG